MKRLLAYMTEISEEDLPFLALFMEYGMYLQRFKASEIPALYEMFNRNTRDVFLAVIERGQRDGSISFKGDPESLFETVVDVIRGNCAFYMLKNADAEEIEMRMNGAIAPCTVCAAGGGDVTYMVLPVRTGATGK